MSVDRELEFIEPEPGQWFYILEDLNAPKHAFDWHEHAAAYGPFESYEAACAHQYDFSQISTPGAMITVYANFEPSAAISELISKTTLNRAV